MGLFLDKTSILYTDYQINYLDDSLSWLRFGLPWETDSYMFLKSVKSQTAFASYDDLLFSEIFSLLPTAKFIQRTSYSIFDAFGDVGGVQAIFFGIVAFLIAPYQKLNFELNAINEIFTVEHQS